MEEAAPRPAFLLLVCGSGEAPDELVLRKLDAVTAAKRSTHRVTLLVGPGESHAVTAWTEDTSSGYVGGVQIEPVYRLLFGRFAFPR